MSGLKNNPRNIKYMPAAVYCDFQTDTNQHTPEDYRPLVEPYYGKNK